ncbi:MAG: aminotransferase class III-fold pyridoxal phosphate-dependent enzyme [Pseudomonadales bacterium]|nr:aminotransferase class III-fold pyridoxal phosphate-dependent enzyme [Pseudomonadales bacterium]
MLGPFSLVLAFLLGAWLLRRLVTRLELSAAKHPTLAGHAKMSKFAARLVPYYAIPEARIFDVDGAPAEVSARRRAAFERLAAHFLAKQPKSIAASETAEASISDLEFTNTYRVPFQFARYVKRHLRLGSFADATDGPRIRDLDGNWAWDLTGSYGVNVFGHEFYKACMDAAHERVRDLGPLLGPFHPCIVENVEKLKAISGLDEVSFHMSGTEAVMQAVRLARYHTRRPKVVTFCGAYHGWWDGVQPGVGNPTTSKDVFMLSEQREATLRVIRTRKDIACVLVNPLQALSPNRPAPGDSTLIGGGRSAHFDKERYCAWLAKLRAACDENGVVLIMDEVFLGFRLARGGAQEYFRTKADMVTYGKTLGGGYPVGVVCGRAELMKRFRDDAPADLCFARGTFNSHPVVMAAMNEFLGRVEAPEFETLWATSDARWIGRREALNARLAELGAPVRLEGLMSVWTVVYEQDCRYNWMFQYYLRAQGLALAWIGTGRFIFSNDYTDDAFAEVADRIVAAARDMAADGWWWSAPTQAPVRTQLRREFVRRLLRGEREAAGT